MQYISNGSGITIFMANQNSQPVNQEKIDITLFAKRIGMFDNFLDYDQLIQIKIWFPNEKQFEFRYEIVNARLLKDCGNYEKGQIFKYIEALECINGNLKVKCFSKSYHELLHNDFSSKYYIHIFTNPELEFIFNRGGIILKNYRVRIDSFEQMQEKITKDKKSEIIYYNFSI